MRMKERAEVVRDRIVLDVGIQTSRTGAACQHVPESDLALSEHSYASSVVARHRSNVRGHDLPEGVLRVRVVLRALQRTAARQGAEDEYASVGSRDRREPEGEHLVRDDSLYLHSKSVV